MPEEVLKLRHDFFEKKWQELIDIVRKTRKQFIEEMDRSHTAFTKSGLTPITNLVRKSSCDNFTNANKFLDPLSMNYGKSW